MGKDITNRAVIPFLIPSRLSASATLSRLSLERAAAAATFDGIRIFEREAAFFDPVVEVDRGAIEIEGTFFVDHDRNAMMLVP